MPTLRQAFAINLGASVVGTASRVAMGLVLARLLRPEELGLFALALAIAGLAHLLRDFGISAYLQRAAEPERLNASVGLMLATGGVSAVGLFGLAEGLAAAVAQPALAPLLRILALGLALSPFGALMASLWARDLAAAQLAQVARLGAAAQELAAVAGAAAGWGATGLAWAQVLGVACCALGYAALGPGWRQWRPTLRGAGEVARFGAGQLGANLLQGLNAALPELWLGRATGALEVGLLGRAQALVQLLPALAGPALSFGLVSTWAELHRRGRPLAPLLSRASGLVTGLAWPVLGLTVLLREPLILLLYGPAWLPAAEAVLPLALAAGLTLGLTHLGAAWAAVGRPELGMSPILATLLARVGCAALGFDGSLAAFAWCLFAATVLTAPVSLRLARRHLGWRPREVAAAWAPALLMTLAAVTTANAALAHHTPSGIAAMLGLAAACGAGWVLEHPWRQELSLVVSSRSGSGRPAPAPAASRPAGGPTATTVRTTQDGVASGR